MNFHLDPGYKYTARMLVESALTLSLDQVLPTLISELETQDSILYVIRVSNKFHHMYIKIFQYIEQVVVFDFNSS